jgi:predicted metal-dependent phosphoesterase TrpH
MTRLCDFHMHSTASDGTLAPDALVARAARCGVGLMALTDHDDVSGVATARRVGGELGVEVWAGVEISVSDRNGEREMHVLGLGIDPEEPRLCEALDRLRAQRDKRGERIVERLREHGIAIEWERVRALAGEGVVGRPHVARALVEIGACADEDEAFSRWLRRRKPAYVARSGLAPSEAASLIHGAGGIAVLAHPPRSIGVDGPGGLEAFVQDTARAGLDGLEVHHPAHRPGQIRKLRRLCNALGLVETGGSDFHGNEAGAIRPGRGRGKLRLGPGFADPIRARIDARRGNPSA